MLKITIYIHRAGQHYPLIYWNPLMKAASFGLLDRIEEGR